MSSYATVRLRGAAFLLLFAMVSCSPEDSDPPLVVQRDSAGIEIIEAMRPLWGDSSLWSIDPEPLVDLALSGSGPRHEFFRVRAVKQRSDGSIVVADWGSRQIRHYARAGEFLGAMGGPGQGPGEFSNLQRIELVADSVLALDYDGRVTVVGPGVELVRVFRLPSDVNEIHALGDGTLLAESSVWDGLEEVANQLIRPPVALVRFDQLGVRVHSIGETRGFESYSYVEGEQGASATPLFAKRSQVAVLGRRIFKGPSDIMQVEELDLSGAFVRIFRLPDYPLVVTEAQVAAEREAQFDIELPPGMTFPPFIRRTIEALPVPATRPAYNEMHVDPSGAVWLELYRGRSEQDRPQEWLVLDADGTWLGTVEVPDRFRVTDITMESVLGVRRDELDVEHPQVLRLTRN